jgi:hypothetical protein
VTQFPEIVIPDVWGGQDHELLARPGEDVAIYSHFNHEGFLRSSSYLIGGVLPVPFTLKKMNLLRESIHLKVWKTEPLLSFR